MAEALSEGGDPLPSLKDGAERRKMVDVPLKTAIKGEDGIWRDEEGTPLPVSASDLERHSYCPLSWHLARVGVGGEGDAIELGRIKHKQIEKAMSEYQMKERGARREMVIWTWWFTIVAALTIDTGAFFFVDDGLIADSDFTRFSRYLVALSVIWLGAAILLLVFPWRRLLGTPFGLAQPPRASDFELVDEELYDFQLSQSRDGGWWEGGKVEVTILLATLTIALHGLALFFARERTIATFVLLVATLVWTFFASIQLHRGLTATTEVEERAEKLGIDAGGIIAYNDDSETSDLLIDEKSGLRGRPDQIVIINNEMVPVEQKTGKVPTEPYFSHILQLYAYMHLVSEITNGKTSYGVLRYGKEALHRVDWGDTERDVLYQNISEVQRLMVEGDAKRNHERRGKCLNCSRRRRCPDPLK